jgi:hypothetical protein
VPTTVYTSYSPVAPPEKLIYEITMLNRKDPLTYIKLLNEDKWLYIYNDNTFKFSELIYDPHSFINYVQPSYFYIDYLDHPKFILYRHRKYGTNKIQYLIYNENNNKIHVQLTSDKKKATIFSFEDFGWNEYLTQHLHAKVAAIGKDNSTPFGSALSFL